MKNTIIKIPQNYQRCSKYFRLILKNKKLFHVFSKGAMKTLAVVATYIDKPELPVGFYEVCRYPIGLPPVDVEHVMKVLKQKKMEIIIHFIYLMVKERGYMQL